jgi:hypothetical protein
MGGCDPSLVGSMGPLVSAVEPVVVAELNLEV